jgi:hypothetical protein
MSIDKSVMIMELKKNCIPVLKSNGFKGSFPNFYKDDYAFIYLLNFQFFSSGGSFCINISYADKDRNSIYFRKDTLIKDIRISQTTVHKRLEAKTQGSSHWFSWTNK